MSKTQMSFQFLRLHFALLVFSVAAENVKDTLHSTAFKEPDWIRDLDLEADDMPEVVRSLFMETSDVPSRNGNNPIHGGRSVDFAAPDPSEPAPPPPVTESVPSGPATSSATSPSPPVIPSGVEEHHKWIVGGWLLVVSVVAVVVLFMCFRPRQHKSSAQTFQISEDDDSFVSSSETTGDTSSEPPARLNSYSRIRSLLASRSKGTAKPKATSATGSASPRVDPSKGRDSGASTLSAETEEEDIAEVYDRVTASLRTLSLVKQKDAAKSQRSHGSDASQ